MSKKNWTKEQLAAITTRNTNLLVAAAAGAGKTAVLVERIIRMVSDQKNPIEIDKLLVVTFTNAAAVEMRERIGSALTAQLSINPHSKHLARQVTLLNRASITTLHSFCLDILRRHFYKLDLDPSFRIAEEIEAELLRLEVIEEVFEKRYQEGETSGFTNLVDTYGGQRDDGKLQGLVLELYRFSSSNPWPREWLKGLASSFDVSPEQSLDELVWVKDIKEQIARETASALRILKEASELAGRPGGPSIYASSLSQDIQMIIELLGSCGLGWETMYRSFTSVSWGKLRPVKGDVDEDLKAKVQELRNRAKEKINDLIKTYFCATMQEIIEDLRNQANLIQELAQLTMDFMDAYQSKKQSRGLVDFGDLEHLCLRVLLDQESRPGNPLPSQVAQELKEHFTEVLVDEYQDINEIQETLLYLVSKPNNRFMVGDVKQSIYRFRLAEPALFLQKYERYSLSENLHGTRVDLTKNFRSRQGVINGVNFVFRQIMTKSVGEMDYDTAAELKYGADFPSLESNGENEVIELHLINRKSSGEEESVRPEEVLIETEEQEELDTDQAEARLVGKKILQLVKGTNTENGDGYRVWDKNLGEDRPVSYRDIVILLRATTGRANVFVEELRALGIPTYADLGTGYFQAVEVEVFLSLLKIIDNPRQDIPLAGVLRSPIVGLNAEDLALIRMSRVEGDFYDALSTAAFSELGPLSTKVGYFLERLEKWRSQARRGSLADLIWELYRETGYYDYVGGMVGGTQRQANLRVLYHRAKQYEATSFRGLFRFLRFMERIRASGSDLGAARSLSENEDVVRIMSIHKSKGLEFPIVFVAGMGRQFNLQDLNKDILRHKQKGIGPQVINLETRVSYPSLPKLLIKQCLKREALAEEMRVLYVALTRAREKLILVGSVRDADKALEKWTSHNGLGEWQLPESELLNARNCLDWLYPALSRHRDCLNVSVTSDVADDPSNWRVKHYNITEMQAKAAIENLSNDVNFGKIKNLEPLEEKGWLNEINHRLKWQYLCGGITSKSAKTNVTEIKRNYDIELYDERLGTDKRLKLNNQPRFLQQDRGLTATEKGTAIHTVMQHINLDKSPNEEEVGELLEYLVHKEIITPEQAGVVTPSIICGFFATSLGIRLLTAKKVKRELPFSLALPAREVYSDLTEEEASTEFVLVQGVIDCLLDEGDGLVLIDYKSDVVRPGQESPAERYKGQINLYTRAVEDIMGKKVKERYVYLFHTGEAVKM